MDKKIETRMMTKILAAVVLLTALNTFSVAQISGWMTSLVSNYPNPFDSRNDTTTIVYDVVKEADVNVKIYDLFGNMVREYPTMRVASGLGRIIWDGTNESGQKVAKGGYLCVVEISYGLGFSVATRKIGVIH